MLGFEWTTNANHALISLKDIKYIGKQLDITIMQKIKKSKPGNHIYPLSFKTYPKDTKFCGVAHLKRYIELTQNLMSSDKILLTTRNLIKV